MSAPKLTAKLEPTWIEVGCTENGRPSYRWVEAFYVIAPDGSKMYPPMQAREAQAFCRSRGWYWVKQTFNTLGGH